MPLRKVISEVARALNSAKVADEILSPLEKAKPAARATESR